MPTFRRGLGHGSGANALLPFISLVSTGRGISPVWGLQFSQLAGLVISRLHDQRLNSLVVARDALRALERKTVG
jgi:hypothetical protein